MHLLDFTRACTLLIKDYTTLILFTAFFHKINRGIKTMHDYSIKPYQALSSLVVNRLIRISSYYDIVRGIKTLMTANQSAFGFRA